MELMYVKYMWFSCKEMLFSMNKGVAKVGLPKLRWTSYVW